MRCLTVTLESSSAANATATETESKPKVEPTAHPQSAVALLAAQSPLASPQSWLQHRSFFVPLAIRASTAHVTCESQH